MVNKSNKKSLHRHHNSDGLHPHYHGSREFGEVDSRSKCFRLALLHRWLDVCLRDSGFQVRLLNLVLMKHQVIELGLRSVRQVVRLRVSEILLRRL